MRSTRAAFAALVFVAATIAATGTAHAAEAQLDSDTVATGQNVLVTGSGFAAGSLVLIQVCGNNGIDGSADCNVAGTAQAGVGANGTFSMTLGINAPPSPCPCVVRVNDPRSLQPVIVPITIIDVPMGVAQSRFPDIGSLLVVEKAEVGGKGPWQAWFGGGADRTLELTLLNRSNIVLDEPLLNVTLGKGDEATQHVASTRLPSFQPGERRIVRVPVRLEAFSWGEYTVSGGLVGYGPQAQFEATTTDYWWGWLVVVVLLVNVVVWRLLRRRRDDFEGDDVGDDVGDDDHDRVLAPAGTQAGGDPVVADANVSLE